MDPRRFVQKRTETKWHDVTCVDRMGEPVVLGHHEHAVETAKCETDTA